MKTRLLNLCIITLVSASLHGQQNEKDSVQLMLSMHTEHVTNETDLRIGVNLKTLKKAVLEVPHQDLWGYIAYHSGFLSIEVQRKKGDKYIDIPEVGRLDGPAGIDVDSLHTNEGKSWSFNISRLYQYIKGNYRIRVLARLSSLNPLKDIYSNWYYFDCQLP